MNDVFSGIAERFLLASAGFEQRLRAVRPEQWDWPTPCADWDVRLLVNHVVRGGLNCADLARGGSAGEFLRTFSDDALGDDPASAFKRSVRECADAFAAPGVLDKVLDFPLGQAAGKRVLAVRTTDTLVHTWDLARALRIDDTLDLSLVEWIIGGIHVLFAGLAETPASETTSHSLFDPPLGGPAAPEPPQNLLLRRTGRDPGAADLAR